MMQVLNFSGISVEGGKRHCPSFATLAPSNLSFLLHTTVDNGESNKGLGKENHQIRINTNNTIPDIQRYNFFLFNG
jgi:hypothetical protein